MFEQLMDGAKLTPRPQQINLVKLAREAMGDDSAIFIQAGTGTGKSYAVLATALEAAKTTKLPSVVVAPTNALVNQYVMKDAPAVQKILGGVFTYIKGRSTYLCTQSPEARKLKTSEAVAIFQKFAQQGIWEWAQAGLNGWGCTGDCNPEYGDLCGLSLAKEVAAEADVVVTNGHILVWNLKVQQLTGGVAQLLPAYGTLFVDECHEIDAVAKSCNSDQIGSSSTVYERIDGLRDWVDTQLQTNFEKNQTELLVQLGEGTDSWLETMVGDAVREANHLSNQIAGMAGNPEAVDTMKELRKELRIYERFISFATSGDDRYISTITKETDRDGHEVPMLNRKCIDSSSWLRPILTNQASILVSGTIPPSLPARVGVNGAPLSDVGTPFHYGESVLAISPFSAAAKDRRSNPNNELKRQREVCGAVANMAGRSHEEGGGGSLVLFTSWRDLDLMLPQIKSTLRAQGINVPVYTQSRTDQQETAQNLEKFKAHGNAVMLGNQSMWTGVDVPGNALRQVIIFQLPWAVPTLEVKAVEKKFGRQPYADDMMTRLVQGIGRLVRKVEDNGRVYIADSRAKNLKWTSNPMSKHVAQFSPFKR